MFTVNNSLTKSQGIHSWKVVLTARKFCGKPLSAVIKQKGYVGLSVVVFMLMLAMIIYPWFFPSTRIDRDCRVGEAPAAPAPELRNLPAIKNMVDAPRLGQPSDTTIGGPDPVEKTDYIMVRKNLHIEKKSVTEGWFFFGGTEITADAHTVNVGEFLEKRGFNVYYPAEWGEIDHIPNVTSNFDQRVWIRGAGLIFFVNNDPATIMETGDNTVYQVEVFQDKRVFDDQTKEYKVEDLFLCDEETRIATANVVIPSQDSSPKKEQLQLEWFRLNGSRIWAVHCKPAVYLYPERKQLINVRVFPKGELGFTDPVYDPVKGWTVLAEPGGNLESGIWSLENKNYDYLYYESKILDSEIKKPDTGWVVKGERGKGEGGSELQSLFNRILPRLGLNEKEKSDFKEYWLKTLPESPYYFVGLMDKGQRDYLEALEVYPKPDTSIRFSLYFEPLDQVRAVAEPIIKTPERTGFTLVDWGGMIKLHSGTEFTCSQ